MYPLVRQIISSVAFHYPEVFVNAKPNAERVVGELDAISTVMERAANNALDIMNAKAEIHQAMFDALFCGVGWIKMGYNPPGDDSMPPYVTNDAFKDDFPCVMRVRPFNVFVDPKCPPQNLGYAEYIIERIEVPFDILKSDSRYKIPRDFTGSSEYTSATDTALLNYGDEYDADNVDEHVQGAKAERDMVVLYEIHDRLNRRLITFLDGHEKEIHAEDHPFIKTKPIYQGETLVGLEESPGFIMSKGFQYIPVKFDTVEGSYFPEPPMKYVEDLQNIIVESMSRRVDVLRRFPRVVWANEAEIQRNPNLVDNVRDAKDGDVIGLHDIASIREASWGNLPSDQLGIENDARGYEEQSLHVSDLAGGSEGRKTATESALIASQGSLNRQWMQSKVADVYTTIVGNLFHMFQDIRYIPRSFMLNVAKDPAGMEYKILTSEDFNFDFMLDLDAGSMHPLVEELEQENSILLYDRLIGNPMIDQVEVTRDLIKSFRKRTTDKLFKGADADLNTLIQLELSMMLQGQMPPVEEGMDHMAHMEQQNPDIVMGLPQLQQMLPQQQQQILQIVQQHMAMHEQAMQATTSAPASGGSQPAVDGRLIENDITSQVRSNAQKTQQAATADVATLTGQGGMGG
tara:strand:+ start:14 stop:1903 length:1890 start_codon:yes stop_codon:yes gene_type:complete